MHRLQRVLNRLVDRVDTPSPIVLADVMQRNIDRMQGFATEHHLDLRPHVKTHKCVEVGRRQVDAGAVGITAGNVGEAEVFAAAGFEDIFLAYPIWPSGTKGDRIRRLARTTQMRVGVDNVAAIEALADAMGEEPDRLQVVVEIDCGARRSGAPPAAAGDLALQPASAGWCRSGVYTYPGHGASGPGSREPAGRDQQAALTAAVRSFGDVGITAEVVSAGSTPTVAFSTSSVITEIRPGEYVFYDLNNTRLGACDEDQIALFVAATVVSDWVPDQVILDVGTKALGREGNPEPVATAASPGRRRSWRSSTSTTGSLRYPAAKPVRASARWSRWCPTTCALSCNSFEELIVTDCDGTTLERWPVAARGLLS